LWILLLTGLFFFFLTLEGVPTPTATFRVPLINLEVPKLLVWASGPAILCFLVLMLMGALRAHTTSQTTLGIGGKADAEAADLHPNALDFAFYTTADSKDLVKWFFGCFSPYFLFPVAVLVLAAFMGWLLYSEASGGLRWVFVAVGLVLWLPAVGFVLSGLKRRCSKPIHPAKQSTEQE
jgi:hypothetical protein